MRRKPGAEGELSVFRQKKSLEVLPVGIQPLNRPCRSIFLDGLNSNHKDGCKDWTSAVLPTRDMNCNSYYLL